MHKERRSKTSNTFLNAFTAPGYTTYKGSSIIEKDFYNILNVYADCIFNPLLTRETFEKEGWRFEINNKGQPTINGIVYNEMKAQMHNKYYSEYASGMKRFIVNNITKYNSGGNPKEIINLSYEEFKEYYDKYYRPENALIIIYGDIDNAKVLNKCEELFANELMKRKGYTKPEYPKNRKEKLFKEYKETSIDFKYASEIGAGIYTEIIPYDGTNFDEIEEFDFGIIQNFGEVKNRRDRFIKELALNYISKYDSRIRFLNKGFWKNS